MRLNIENCARNGDEGAKAWALDELVRNLKETRDRSNAGDMHAAVTEFFEVFRFSDNQTDPSPVRAALAAQPGAVGEANTDLIAHMRLLNEYIEACNAGNTKTHMKAADAARQKVEASALSLISAKARSEPDCAGGMPCTDCPDKRKCQAGCIRQGEALTRPDQESPQRHPLDVEALYELQKVMADFGGDWPDVPGEQEVVRRAKMLSRLWKSESTTEVVGLNGRQRMLLAQAWTMLEDYAEGNRRAGKDSFADGAIASAHEIKLLLAGAPTEAKPAQDAVDAERPT